MWQYCLFVEKCDMMSTDMMSTELPSECHRILLLLDWFSRTFHVGRGTLHARYLVQQYEVIILYPANRNGENNPTVIHIYLPGPTVTPLSQRYRTCSSLRFMKRFIHWAAVWIRPKVLHNRWLIPHSDRHGPCRYRSFNDIFIIVLSE